MDHFQLDNKLNSFLDSFIEHFSITLFFIKPVPKRYYPIIKKKTISDKRKTGTRKEKKVILGSEHYNLLWLANELLKQPKKFDENGNPVIELKQLQQVFFWYTKSEYSYLQRLNNMARRLCDTGFLDSVKKQTSYYWITDEGKQLLKDLRKERKKYLAKFFNLNDIKSDIYSKILEIGESITPVLWDTINKESNEIEIPRRPAKDIE